MLIKKNKIAFLDLGGVVFQSTGQSNDKIHWDIISALNIKYGFDLNIGLDKFPNFLKEYNKKTSQNLIGQQFLRYVFDTLEINKTLIDLVSLEYEIIIVSDNYRENINYISKRYNFDKWAINQFYSFDYKMVKANPLFFKRLLKELPYAKEQIIFIDDSPNKLKSAQINGIRGIQFINNEQVRKELYSN